MIPIPLGTKILVRVEIPNEMSGLVIPERAHREVNSGVVAALGEVASWPPVGSVVRFRSTAGAQVSFGGADYRFLEASDILCLVVDSSLVPPPGSLLVERTYDFSGSSLIIPEALKRAAASCRVLKAGSPEHEHLVGRLLLAVSAVPRNVPGEDRLAILSASGATAILPSEEAVEAGVVPGFVEPMAPSEADLFLSQRETGTVAR